MLLLRNFLKRRSNIYIFFNFKIKFKDLRKVEFSKCNRDFATVERAVILIGNSPRATLN